MRPVRDRTLQSIRIGRALRPHHHHHHRPLPPQPYQPVYTNQTLANVQFRKMDVRDRSYFDRMQSQKSFEEGQDRIGFIRKVYGILSLSLILTALMAAIPMFDNNMRRWILRHSELLWASIAGAIFIEFLLICFRTVSRTVPINYLCFLAFTVCEGYIIMFTASYSEPDVVLMAACFTAAMVIGLTVYAFQTEKDFSFCGGSVAIIGSVMLVFGIVLIFFKSALLINVYCSLSVIVFGFYLVYHTQLVIGGGRYELSDDDYILGALIIYIDIIMIFVHLVRLLTKKN